MVPKLDSLSARNAAWTTQERVRRSSALSATPIREIRRQPSGGPGTVQNWH